MSYETYAYVFLGSIATSFGLKTDTPLAAGTLCAGIMFLCFAFLR
jgi:hypothetical protein